MFENVEKIPAIKWFWFCFEVPGLLWKCFSPQRWVGDVGKLLQAKVPWGHFYEHEKWWKIDLALCKDAGVQIWKPHIKLFNIIDKHIWSIKPFIKREKVAEKQAEGNWERKKNEETHTANKKEKNILVGLPVCQHGQLISSLQMILYYQ